MRLDLRFELLSDLGVLIGDFALLGGVQVYGMLGILVAPVVVALLIAFVEIYREHLSRIEANEPPPEDA